LVQGTSVLSKTGAVHIAVKNTAILFPETDFLIALMATDLAGRDEISFQVFNDYDQVLDYKTAIFVQL
jgi:hypothetical protein